MKSFYIFFLCITVFVASCNKETVAPQNNELVGNWKLTAFVDEVNDTSILENDFANTGPFFINLKDDYNITGNTFRNNILGKYALNDSEKILTFLEFGTDTEINETDWGWLFFDKLHLNYNQSTKHYDNSYILSEGELKLYYSENEYMKFEKM